MGNVDAYIAHGRTSNGETYSRQSCAARGPFVYCLEETDNGASLHQLTLPMEGKFDLHFDGELLGGIQTIIAEAVRYHSSDWNGALYRNGAGWQLEPVKAVFIPYYAWANRGLGEMNVWVRQVR